MLEDRILVLRQVTGPCHLCNEERMRLVSSSKIKRPALSPGVGRPVKSATLLRLGFLVLGKGEGWKAQSSDQIFSKD